MNLKSFLSVILLLTLLLWVVEESNAQRRRSSEPILEELPQKAIDTLSTSDPETFVITFSNNTWSYYRPTIGEKLEDVDALNQNWDTTQVFSYKSIALNDLPSVTDIKLIAELDDFHPPIVGKIFSKYGRRGRRNHNGVDIPLTTGEPIYATFDGRIRYAKFNNGGFGNLVIVRHTNGLETWYAHLSKLNVGSEEYVKAGQIIGFGGSTGRSRGPHLHFEVRYCDQTFDPEHLFDFENGSLKYQTFALEKGYFNIQSRASDQLEEHDFDDYASLSLGDGDEVTSEDILNHITQQNKSTASSGGGKSSGSETFHTIRSGDMLGKLAIRYGVSIDQICRLNGISRSTILQLGRRLRIN